MNLSDIDKLFSFAPVMQSLIFCILFFALYRVKQQRNFLFIGFYHFFLTLFFCMTFMFYYQVHQIVAYSFYFTIPVTLMLIPMFYLYAECLTTPCKEFKIQSWFHFLPSILVAIAMLPYWLLPNSEKLWFVSGGYGHSHSEWIISYITWIFRVGVFLFINIQFLIYLFLFNRLINHHRNRILKMFSYTEKINLKWLFNLFIVFFVFVIFLYLSRYFGIRHDIYNRMAFNTGFVLLNLFIGIKGVLQPNIFSLFKDNQKIAESIALELLSTNPQSEPSETNDQKKYPTSNLSEDLKLKLKKELIDYMQRQPYHQSNFNIEDVADALQTNTRYISQVVNESFQQNFFSFVNSFRIQEAKEILTSSDSNKYSIEGVAKIVGFNSKSSFNTFFKKQTGVTPSEFKKGNTV